MDFHPMLPKAYTMFIYPSLCNHTFLHFHQPVLPSQPYQLHQHQLPHIINPQLQHGNITHK